MLDVAILFARQDSIYKTMPGLDVYDIDRDARTYAGELPVVAHPPCRAWGALRHFAKPRPDERELALWAVDEVRRCGGVLEHPAASRLWPEKGLPDPGRHDSFGGFTLPIDQDWFGHRAEKRTRLYIVGCEPRDVPPIPIKLEEPTHVIAMSRDPGRGLNGQRLRKGMPGWKPEVTRAEREHTPPTRRMARAARALVPSSTHRSERL